MKLRDHPQQYLTYCLNIHPGETWEENFAAIRDNATKVRDAVAKDGAPFGLGLRLSNIAARTLVEKPTLEAFKRFLAEQNMYVFTINGFPYGTFHGKPVKDAVYRPDWRTPERRDYTIVLSDILAALLPDGVPGSISSVPASYKEWIRNDGDIKLMVENLLHCAAHLDNIEKKTGKHISLALEPEPDCFLETTDDIVNFFKKHVPSRILPYIGVCFDTCHLAVQFEDLEASLERILGAGISVPKIQFSAAVKAQIDDSSLRELEKFCDPVYLHQVRIRNATGEIERYKDLSPDLLSALASERGTELRAHFHVPLYFAVTDGLDSTASDLTPEFFRAVMDSGIPHIEIETYTFDVLPAELRLPDAVASIVKEYEWVMRHK